MLNVQNVTKFYGKVKANDNISFSVDDGQIAILLGPNGAGKSTIIKCIAGLLRFEGEITMNKHPNRSLEAKAALGYVPETPAVYDMLTVAEHLEFVRRANRLEDDGLAERLLERFDLSNLSDKLGKELSKGMQQKVSICCALLRKPSVIIFDEPMVGLDPYAIKELKQVFQELRNEGSSVLISTHMIDSVEDYWDIAHIMANGAIVASKVNNGNSGAPDDKSLEELFFENTEGVRNQS